jgi:hypothetical protein
VFGLFTPGELDAFDASEVNATEALEGLLPLATIQSIFSGPPATVTGFISTRDVYTVFLYTGFNSTSGNAIISADFSNGDSRLDYRAAPALIERPIALALFSVVVAAWLTNWFCNSNLKIYVHFFLTGTFLSSILSQIARVVYVVYTDTHDFTIGAQAISLFFRAVFQVLLCVAILLCAKGWCIVRQRIAISELGIAFGLAAGYIVMNIVLDTASVAPVGSTILTLIMLVCLGGYAWVLVSSSRLAQLYIYAYLLRISNSGIDPETTPVWEKQRMFDRLQYCIILYVSLLLVQAVVRVVVPGWAWVFSLAEDVADLAVIGALAAVYRLRGGSRNGFALIDDGALELFEIEAAPPAAGGLRKGGRVWETGMALPPPPGSPQNVVTIETPDGVFEIAVRFEAPLTA